jgi:hypothetical protein
MSIADGSPVNAAASNAAFVSRSATQTVGGQKTFTDTTESTSKDTGSLILEGGIGVEKNINSGGNSKGESLETNSHVQMNDSGSNYVRVKAPSVVNSNYELQMPQDQGASGTTLINDGNGQLVWDIVSSQAVIDLAEIKILGGDISTASDFEALYETEYLGSGNILFNTLGETII